MSPDSGRITKMLFSVSPSLRKMFMDGIYVTFVVRRLQFRHMKFATTNAGKMEIQISTMNLRATPTIRIGRPTPIWRNLGSLSAESAKVYAKILSFLHVTLLWGIAYYHGRPYNSPKRLCFLTIEFAKTYTLIVKPYF